jgi:hypothetical protein
MNNYRNPIRENKLGAVEKKKPYVSTHSYYAQYGDQYFSFIPLTRRYYGHDVKYLQEVLDSFNEHFPGRPNIYFVGDSSLDNKYWIHDYADAVNGYENILGGKSFSIVLIRNALGFSSFPPRFLAHVVGKMKQDVCYHVSRQCQLLHMHYGVINCAVEVFEFTLKSFT